MKPIADVSKHSITELTQLSGRTAVVTGAAQGLGKAIARRLAEAGANVVLGDLKIDVAKAAAQELNTIGPGKAVSHRLDVSDSESVTGIADFAIKEFGRIDIWVNNAGVFPSTPVVAMSDADWNRVLDVNTSGTFFGSREAARRMTANDRGGVIVNVASTAAFRGVAHGLAAYVSSKHAVRGLTRQMALELAPHGIRVLGVAPTFCVTEGNLEAMAQHPDFSGDADSIPVAMLSSKLGRVGVPDDIARVVLFCVSDMSLFMTGSTLPVDAGELA